LFYVLSPNFLRVPYYSLECIEFDYRTVLIK
jgi:hypothetical protein